MQKDCMCCGQLNNGPTDTQVLIPRTCAVNLYGKRDFVDGIKLRILRWATTLDYQDGP